MRSPALLPDWAGDLSGDHLKVLSRAFGAKGTSGCGPGQRRWRLTRCPRCDDRDRNDCTHQHPDQPGSAARCAAGAAAWLALTLIRSRPPVHKLIQHEATQTSAQQGTGV